MKIIEFDVPLVLTEKGVEGIRKEGKTIVVIYKGAIIRFDIRKTWSHTVESFQYACKELVEDKMLVQSIITCLSQNWLKMNTASRQNCLGENEIGNKSQHEPDNFVPAQVDLISEIPSRDYVDFVIETIKKTVKREDVLVRQVLYAGLSTYTFEPLNLAILAPTSEGKTYGVTQVMKLFPKEDVWFVEC